MSAVRVRDAGPAGVPEESPDEPAGGRWAAGVRGALPWEGRAGRVDLVIVAAILGVVVLGLVVRPLTPFLLAEHPVLLALLTGDLVPIGAGAAFARVGAVPLWLVVAAGAIGMVKFDWLAWWAGRRWGAGIVRMFTTSERTRRLAARVTRADPRLVRLAVVAAVLPGVPTAVVFAAAGWARVRLTTFLLLDLVGALSLTALVSGLGYGLGRRAVDVVLAVDRYAATVSLTVVLAALLVPVLKRCLRRTAGPAGRGAEQG